MEHKLLKSLVLTLLLVVSSYAYEYDYECSEDFEEDDTSSICIENNGNCQYVADGDYPICGRGCQEGFYFSCSNEIGYKMPCAEEYYEDSYGVDYSRKMIFDPELGTCESEVPSCPRDK